LDDRPFASSTAVNVKLLLPPRQSRGTSLIGLGLPVLVDFAQFAKLLHLQLTIVCVKTKDQ
jgi:hypothetical protein